MVNLLLLGLFVGGMTTGYITPLSISEPVTIETRQENVEIEERAFTNLEISCADLST